MSEEKIKDPEAEKSTAVDPPNNASDQASSLSPAEGEVTAPVDPPPNT